jgi:hypothetical protein
MKLFKLIKGFLFSLKTAIWLLGLLLIMFLAGAFIMPGRQEFQTIHSMPLFEWMVKQPVSITWWLWCIIVILFILSINTILCSIESIIKKHKVTQWLLLISPQIIHLGFIFMLIAHLMSAIGGYQRLVPAMEGMVIPLAEDINLKIKDIEITLDYYGYINDWGVEVEYQRAEAPAIGSVIGPNKPFVHAGFNINVRDLRPFPREIILLQINSDPGVIWALMGGILFMIGIIILIALKIKIER